MTTKPIKKKVDKPIMRDPNTLQVSARKGDSEVRLLAETSLSTTTINAVTARSFSKVVGVTDLTETINVMRDKVIKVNDGDLTELEATLTAQTVTLDTMFNELARRAVANMGTHMQVTESYMRLALKAQSQCARTIEVLANMKNPPIVYAKQMNVANGNQQVNNGNNLTTTHAPAHTGKIINPPNELLSEMNNATMDTSGTATTSRTDKAMAAVEK